MRNLLNPKWLFLINTIPVVIFIGLCYYQYSVIKPLLGVDHLNAWNVFWFALGSFAALNFGYVVYLFKEKQGVSIGYSFIALTCYIAFIFWNLSEPHRLIPSQVPVWVETIDIVTYVGTFLMPTLLYSIVVLVLRFTSENKEHKAAPSFLATLAVPVLVFLFVQIILPLCHNIEGEYFDNALMVCFIAAILAFVFFFIRGVFILATNKKSFFLEYQLLWKPPLVIVGPIIGLLINNGYLPGLFHGQSSGPFGDFSSKWFYILAFINGLLLCLSNKENKWYRLFLFIGRVALFIFTLYFFIIFLPFLPLGIMLIVFFGIGLLILVPIGLFLIHVATLVRDFEFLKRHFSKPLLFISFSFSFFIIPISVTTSYLYDRIVIREALDYVCSPDYSARVDIDRSSLRSTLDVIVGHGKKRRSHEEFFYSNAPFISTYFNWIVLDNRTVSSDKVARLEKVFFNDFTADSDRRNPDDVSNVRITDVDKSTKYDSTQMVWKTWVDIELTNLNSSRFLSEYKTTIQLTEGCWISDYYLFVGDRKEFGILAEKKSAMWIYSRILNQRRDPGILYYLSGNKVEFRVFPFTQNEVRRTGIEFIHKEPLKVIIDGITIELGAEDQSQQAVIESEDFIYISPKEKNKLQSINRTPYFHFIVNASENQNERIEDFTGRIEQFCKMYPKLSNNAKVSLVNSYVSEFDLESDWRSAYSNHLFEGGFFVDRAIRSTIVNAYRAKSDSYPVIVLVSDSIENAIWEKDFSDLQFALPDSDFFYVLGKGGEKKKHSLFNNPTEALEFEEDSCMFCDSVLRYECSDGSVAYLKDNNEPSLILKKDFFTLNESDIKDKSWYSALAMKAKWNSQMLHPENTDEEWLGMVRASFTTKIMTPVTSYLVVETEEQKEMLRAKQEQVLSGSRIDGLDNETIRMSEPGLIMLGILLIILLRLRDRLILRRS